MKIKTIEGKLIDISKNELIYNALKKMADLCNQVDAVYLVLTSSGILVNTKDLNEIIEEYMQQYT